MKAEQLWASILQEAIQGKLVPQLESEPKVVQVQELPEDVPFNIPEKWTWIRLGELVNYGCSKQIEGSKITSSTWVLDLEDVEKSSGKLLQKKYGTKTTSNKSCFKKGDVLYGKLRPYLNKVLIADEDGCCSTEIVPINVSSAKLKIDAEFLSYFLRSPYFVGYANSCAYGVKMPRLGTKDAKSAWVAIPPITEQRRIVVRLQKIRSLVDTYCHEEIQFSQLITEFPDKLKASILQEAIQGKLVPQLESEPEVAQIGVKPHDAPFAIPKKWKWVQLKTVGKIVGGGTPKTNIPDYWDNGRIPWFTPADLGKVSDIYVGISARKITEKGLANSSATMMPANSVLFSSRAPIGYIALAREDCCTNQGCKSFVANELVISSLWAYWVLKARTQDIIERASGTTFKEISGRGMGDTWIPLPPMEEQERIVYKIKELFNLVKTIQ